MFDRVFNTPLEFEYPFREKLVFWQEKNTDFRVYVEAFRLELVS